MATLEELEAQLKGWESWREEAVRRFTAVEEAVAAGQERLALITKQVQPALEIIARLSSADREMADALTGASETVAALAEQLQALDTRVQGIAKVARPGRSVVRTEVETLKAQVAALEASQAAGTDTEEAKV